MNAFDNFSHLLEDADQILKDLNQKREIIELHAKDRALPQAHYSGLRLAVRRNGDAANKNRVEVSLACRRINEEQLSLLDHFSKASSLRRNEMLTDAGARLTLHSIIFAEYRPGPVFHSEHNLLPGTLAARVTPGGDTWETAVNRQSLTEWARNAVRLDNADGQHRGSGTLINNGQILTAAHVIGHPGFVFGEPPSQAHGGRAGFNRVYNSQSPHDLTVQGYHADENLDYAWINSPEGWLQDLGGSEFATNQGLPLQKTELSADYLAGRLVAVLGHPAQPTPGSRDAEKARLVFNDAPLQLKRFMPGMIHPTQPFECIDGITYIRHDCSTLSGASGGCLMDLKTGVIIGVHVTGVSPGGEITRNGAVPAWMIM